MYWLIHLNRNCPNTIPANNVRIANKENPHVSLLVPSNDFCFTYLAKYTNMKYANEVLRIVVLSLPAPEKYSSKGRPGTPILVVRTPETPPVNKSLFLDRFIVNLKIRRIVKMRIITPTVIFNN